MRNFRLKSNVWYVRQYKGDGALYAKCKCGYQYNCTDRGKVPWQIKLGYLYDYCPYCGRKMHWMEIRDDLYERVKDGA